MSKYSDDTFPWEEALSGILDGRKDPGNYTRRNCGVSTFTTIQEDTPIYQTLGQLIPPEGDKIAVCLSRKCSALCKELMGMLMAVKRAYRNAIPIGQQPHNHPVTTITTAKYGREAVTRYGKTKFPNRDSNPGRVGESPGC
ncbi:hypothetical protein F441_18177 [Phytophthora nicotianae CJ01A1]|uniref:Uncharacterized protein n=3 Tax=Phytophthora nicotianae TaxID=4792 RepID=W2YE65_PHYNI|nr:hypothetical protein L916_17724 [Phytophthora nicotianae]ETM35481.1 hypothetical protein L914_17633 [Phytophthora nicotianae]ETP05183.1 hypothetical protein F441_18177 [Phytophthora nicotianae CJ01A1]ETP33325.1 hypothetical protein F442_18135 [Phytophthora nicotianae P10297]